MPRPRRARDRRDGRVDAPTLSVTASDPAGGNLDVKFYGRPASAPSADFTLVALPDTQNYSANNPVGSAATFSAQTQWVVDQRASRNILFVTHLGDITDGGDGTPAQWVVADTAMTILDGHVPYGFTPGNHDKTGGTSAEFNAHFGVSRYESQPWYGGHYGSDNLNSYQLFEGSGMQFMVLHVEVSPSPAVLAWASGIVAANPGRRVILSTHQYLTAAGSRDTVGDSIWNGLVNSSCSIFMVLSGHAPGSSRSTATNSCGNTVQQILQDYQSVGAGGDGYLRSFVFHPAADDVDVTTYSPTLGTFRTGNDAFSFAYDMVAGAPFAQIGTTQSVTSGGTASVAWPSLSNEARLRVVCNGIGRINHHGQPDLVIYDGRLEHRSGPGSDRQQGRRRARPPRLHRDRDRRRPPGPASPSASSTAQRRRPAGARSPRAAPSPGPRARPRDPARTPSTSSSVTAPFGCRDDHRHGLRGERRPGPRPPRSSPRPRTACRSGSP